MSAGALERGQSSWMSTATLIGAMLGALAAGRIADLVGRRDVIMATAALFTVGAFVSAIAPSELVLLVGRLVVGLGVGAISVAAPLYISEIAPIARRGTMICIFQLMVTLGILLAYIGLVVFPEESQWRLLLGGGAVAGLLLNGLALLLVESPVWLALVGDRETAKAVETRLGLDNSSEELGEVLPTVRDNRSDGLSAVFSLAGRGAIFIGIGLFFVQQFVGINAVIYYSAANLEKLADANSEFGGQFDRTVGCNSQCGGDAGGHCAGRSGRAPPTVAGESDRGCRWLCRHRGWGDLTPNGCRPSHFRHRALPVHFRLCDRPRTDRLGRSGGDVPIRVRGMAMGIVVASHWLFDGIAAPTGLLLGNQLAST